MEIYKINRQEYQLLLIIKLKKKMNPDSKKIANLYIFLQKSFFLICAPKKKNQTTSTRHFLLWRHCE